MCTFLVLLIPDDADLDRAIGLARQFGFAPDADHGLPLPARWQGACLFASDDAQCHCGTAIGRGHRDVADVAALETESRLGARAKWSEPRRRRRLEQKLRATQRQPAPLSTGACPELDRWLALAQAALDAPRVGRIGLVKQESDHGVRHWLPAVHVPASLASLQTVDRCTPTWFVA